MKSCSCSCSCSCSSPSASLCLCLLLALGCGERASLPAPDGGAPAADGAAGTTAGTQALFDLDADLTQPAHFFSFPYPSDLRVLPAAGPFSRPGPDLRGFPNPRDNDYVRAFLRTPGERPGFPVLPVAYFRFSAPLAKRAPDAVVPATAGSPLLLIDVDPSSPERGRLHPVVSDTPIADDIVPPNLLAIAPRPGIVLAPDRTYAFVVLRSLGDATGRPLEPAPALAELTRGRVPPGARGSGAARLYAPLWETLATVGIPATDVAAATVFTTGDVVAELARMSAKVRERYPVTIAELHVDPDDGAAHERYCELVGHARLPQFQPGVSPFYDATTGYFTIGADGLPEKTGELDVPIVLTLPKQAMPAQGFPLAAYFHGSDGLSGQVVDRGLVTVAGGTPAKGEGPAHTYAPFGLAMFGAGLPVSPERIDRSQPAGGCIDVSGYINLCNFPVLRDDFRQGVLEQHLLFDALFSLRIPPATVAACTGLALPPGEPAFKLDPAQLVATGQSMGGMYTNIVAATDARVRAVVPTGAGGFWTYFILNTDLIPGLSPLLSSLVGADDTWTFMHPLTHLAETGLEWSDPIVYVPRLARRPLPGHPARAIYEPVAPGDEYFRTTIYDAMALAYGNQQAGEEVWPTLQPTLALEARDGLAPYPISQNRRSEDGRPYTGVVVQYRGDGIEDPHVIAFQLDAVKFQIGCFFSTFLATGVATVPAPAPLGSPCPR